jgi:hypothetical protein
MKNIDHIIREISDMHDFYRRIRADMGKPLKPPSVPGRNKRRHPRVKATRKPKS